MADGHRSWRTDLASVGMILRTAWRLNPRACAMSFLEALGRVLDALRPTMMGVLVGGLVAHRAVPALAGLAVLVLSDGAGMLLATAGVHERLRLYELVGHEFDQRTARLLAAPPTLDHLEDSDYLDRFQIFRDRPGALGSAFNSLVNCVNNLATPVVLVGAAIAADWRMILVAVAGALTLLTGRYGMRWDEQGEKESATPSRQAQEFMRLALDPTASAELRVFGARPWLLHRLTDAVRRWLRPLTRASLKEAALDSAVNVAYFLVAGAVLVWIAIDAARGRVTVAHLTVTLASVGGLAAAFGGLVLAMQTFAAMLRSLRRYRALEDYADAHPVTGHVPAPEQLTSGISLRGVDFAYPGSDVLALRDFSLDLPAGATVAIVGENGAGKSTLVKLLTGMYGPSAGSILVDGVPLPDIDVADWRAHCSGAFQDHLRLHMAAVDAITVGDLAAVGDHERAQRALDAAAAADVVNALPDGLDTVLGTDAGGVELSGGQWQRIAIARAMMRSHPLLLVLDEPTSALDPATESALFDGYADAARAAGSRGGITLLVTHRFSTVAAADLVVVLDKGQVAELGTHQDLMAQRGRYAELYELQARGYR